MHSMAVLKEVRRDAPARVRGELPADQAADQAPGQAAGQANVRGGVTEGCDGEVVNRLAVLSGRKPPSGVVLFAELDGEPVAAIGIFDGNVVADRARFSPRLRLRLRLERLFVRAVIAVRGI